MAGRSGDNLSAMPDSPTRLEITVIDGGLALSGEVDAHTAPRLSEGLSELLTGESDVVVDLAGVEFMDSSGLRVMVDADQRTKAAGTRLLLRNPAAAVRRLFEISGLVNHLNIDG